jgi:hypothetical protein
MTTSASSRMTALSRAGRGMPFIATAPVGGTRQATRPEASDVAAACSGGSLRALVSPLSPNAARGISRRLRPATARARRRTPTKELPRPTLKITRGHFMECNDPAAYVI